MREIMPSREARESLRASGDKTIFSPRQLPLFFLSFFLLTSSTIPQHVSVYKMLPRKHSTCSKLVNYTLYIENSVKFLLLLNLENFSTLPTSFPLRSLFLFSYFDFSFVHCAWAPFHLSVMYLKRSRYRATVGSAIYSNPITSYMDVNDDIYNTTSHPQLFI